MPTLNDYRRENLRNVIDRFGGSTKVAKLLGLSNSTFLLQMVGPSPMRQVSEESARKYELALDLPPGMLDKPVDIPASRLVDPALIKARQANLYRKRKGLDTVPLPEPVQQVDHVGHNPDLMSRDQLSELVSLVGRVADEQRVNVPTSKFSDIISLALLNRDESKEDFVKRLVMLTK